MLVVIAVMFVLTGMTTYFLYTKRAMADIKTSLSSAISDTQTAIALGVNDYLYSLAYVDVGDSMISVLNLTQEDLPDTNGDSQIAAADVNDYLEQYAAAMNAKEINLIDANGIIQYSNVADYIGFDMTAEDADNTQAYEFFQNIQKNGYYVQEYRPTAYNEENSLRYAGIYLDETSWLLGAGGLRRF